MIEVKVIEVPGAVREVALNTGATVQDALTAAGVTVRSGFDIKVDGTTATTSTTLRNGARVILAKGAKGNK